VEVAGLVLAEGGDADGGVNQLRVLPARALPLERPDATAAKIAVEVEALHARERAAAVDVAADHGAAEAVVILHHGQRQSGRVTRRRVEAVQPLHDPPAVILPARAAGVLKVNLLEKPLADVA